MTRLNPQHAGPAAAAPVPTRADTSLWVARLRRVLDEQEELFAGLDGLSREQRTHIESENSDALLSLLAQREVLLHRIAQVNRDIEPFRREWDTLSAQLDDRTREALQRRFNALGELLGEILSRDERDRLDLESRRNRLAGQMAEVSRGRGAIGAYAAQQARPETSPKFQDREA